MNKKVHFFKAKTNLGIINLPNKSTESNLGVKFGPDAVLSEEFLKSFPTSTLDTYNFPDPETIDKTKYLEELSGYLKACQDFITERIESDIQVVVGGDHSITFSTVQALLQKVDPTKLAIIHIDTHPDLNLASTSPSGNFHGMYMRAMFDSFDSDVIERLAPKKLPTQNLILIGNLDADDAERSFIEKNEIVNFNRENLMDATTAIQQIMEGCEHVHVNFDIDVFDQSVSKATGIPITNGLLPDEIFPILEFIKKNTGDYSVDLVEVNPEKEGAKETIELAQKVLTTLLN